MLRISELLNEYRDALDFDSVDKESLLGLLREEIRRIENKLREAADTQADLGFIHNTPGSKFDWIER